MKHLPRKSGFTLIELLIASTIFVTVMVLATAIFSMAASYNGKLTEMRRTSLDGRRIMEQLSNDARLANGFAKYDGSNIGEVTFFDCGLIDGGLDKGYIMNKTNCEMKSYQYLFLYYLDALGAPCTRPSCALYPVDPAHPSPTLPNSLLILQKDSKKMILYVSVRSGTSASGFGYDIFRKEMDFNSTITDVSDFGNIFASQGNFNDRAQSPQLGWVRLNDVHTDFSVGFAGYAASKSTKIRQSYVEFSFRSQTWNYDVTQVNSRARFDAKTAVETRDYN